ncbi:DUF4245 domain-containing protein [Nocardioides terrisoli]|uniref:DUF4245 domain-containing protein n=1 Tax=Nocardioides terrisoli TaxID=3388267 RepID=UPI00287BB902|nr:DUF4245 domain-containing protein [Nocardioides marmorisolisilvae]
MPEPAKPNRYELPVSSMVGAMLVVLAVIGAFVAWRALNRDNEGVRTPTVDYSGWVRAGRTDGRLQIVVPTPMPKGWRATSASYTAGVSPHWHLGVLTSGNEYVGIEEGIASVGSMVHQYVDPNAQHGKPVTIHGVRWQTWTDSGGDYAVVRHLKAPKGTYPETLLVVGSAAPAQVRSYAASLR